MALVVSAVSGTASGVRVWKYDNLDSADTSPAVLEPGSPQLFGSIQAIGTFGGATVKLQGSNNGTNWIDLNDTAGSAIGLSAAGASEFSTAMRYIRPLATGGTGDDIDVFICLRGA